MTNTQDDKKTKPKPKSARLDRYVETDVESFGSRSKQRLDLDNEYDNARYWREQRREPGT